MRVIDDTNSAGLGTDANPQFKIFKSVVCPVSVFMMHRLAAEQWTAEVLRHNDTMFKQCFAVDAQIDVTLSIQMSASFPCGGPRSESTRSSHTGLAAEPSGVSTARRHDKENAAMGTVPFSTWLSLAAPAAAGLAAEPSGVSTARGHSEGNSAIGTVPYLWVFERFARRAREHFIPFSTWFFLAAPPTADPAAEPSIVTTAVMHNEGSAAIDAVAYLWHFGESDLLLDNDRTERTAGIDEIAEDRVFDGGPTYAEAGFTSGDGLHFSCPFSCVFVFGGAG